MNSLPTTPERTSASDRVAVAVPETLGTDPASLDPPLYEVLDPDALDGRFQAGGAPTVAFRYLGRRVVVEPDAVTVDEPTDDRTGVPD